MSLALYRKYRPQIFADVTNQNHVKITIGNEIATGRLAHAYIFTGPRGVGKTTIARLFTKAVNCETRKDGTYEPCNTCASCAEITAGSALDIIEIDAATHTGVDSVRENIIENARFSPTKSKYKVFIIDEAHMLSASSWNALLKTLEEPPAHALFILATTEVHKVPDTILSRCQRFDFHKLGVDAIVDRLKIVAAGERVKVDDAVLSAVARQAGGSIRDGESLLGQIFALGESRVTVEVASLVLPHSDTGMVLDFLDAIARGDASQGFTVLHKAMDEGIDAVQFVGEAVEILRHILVQKIGAHEQALEFDEAVRKRIGTIAELMGTTVVLRAIEVLLTAREGLRRAEIPELPLEIALATLCLERGQIAPSDRAVSIPKITKEKTIEPSPPAATRPKVHVQLEEVKAAWAQVIAKVGETSAALPFVLNLALPVGIKDGTLVLAVQYSLHAAKINEARARDTVSRAIESLLGVNMGVAAEIGAGVPLGETTRDPSLVAALDILGGKDIG